MAISKVEYDKLVHEIEHELRAKMDGAKKNLIARCPYCGKDGKYGVYVGKETEKKKPFMAHCFSCGQSTTTVDQLLEVLRRPDLMTTKTVDFSEKLDFGFLLQSDDEDEIDDSLVIIEMPDFYKRTFSTPYLKSRGFAFDDYEYFPVGTTCRLNRKFDDYVIFPVFDGGYIVGYVARHTWSKDEIDTYNVHAKIKGEYKIMRFRNSTENDFVKLLYNYDAVIEGVTDTVIVVEGIFDVIALTRKLNLYDNNRIAVVATFGKKISQTQIYKLQRKGVETIVLGYDGDAVYTTLKVLNSLTPYFEVFVADIRDSTKDWEDLSYPEIYDIFSNRLIDSIEYKINKIQTYG